MRLLYVPLSHWFHPPVSSVCPDISVPTRIRIKSNIPLIFCSADNVTLASSCTFCQSYSSFHAFCLCIFPQFCGIYWCTFPLPLHQLRPEMICLYAERQDTCPTHSTVVLHAFEKLAKLINHDYPCQRIRFPAESSITPNRSGS